MEMHMTAHVFNLEQVDRLGTWIFVVYLMREQAWVLFAEAVLNPRSIGTGPEFVSFGTICVAFFLSIATFPPATLPNSATPMVQAFKHTILWEPYLFKPPKGST